MPNRKNPDIRKAALIIIGNEILSGRTQDTNVQWIAEKLVHRGVLLVEVRIIPDDTDIIVSTINDLRKTVDYVMTTGGIGPTHDDITADAVAIAFGVPLEQRKEAVSMLAAHYGQDNLTPPRMKMAMIPQGASLINNPVTAAPGFRIENVFVMAGVPRIMQAMLDHVMDMMEGGPPILSNTIACSLPESLLAEDLGNLQQRYPDVDMGSYPHFRGGLLGLSLVLRSLDPDRLDSATMELLDLIRQHGDEPRAISVRSRS